MVERVRVFFALAILIAFVGQLPAQDITTGLTGRWRLAESAGTTAGDSCAVPHTGTYNGGVALASSTPVPVDESLAANFDGVDDSVAIPSESTFDYTGPITVA